MNFEQIKKINPNIINGENIQPFAEQLLDLQYGEYDTKFPMVVSTSTEALKYIKEIDIELPLVMNTTTAQKISTKHDIGFAYVSRCERMLKESVLGFQSLSQGTSTVVLLDDFQFDNPVLAILRRNKEMGGSLSINEITSIYDKERLHKLLEKTWAEDKLFYKNGKTEQYFKSIGLQLPKGLKYALSDDYSSTSFNRSQVELALLVKDLEGYFAEQDVWFELKHEPLMHIEGEVSIIHVDPPRNLIVLRPTDAGVLGKDAFIADDDLFVIKDLLNTIEIVKNDFESPEKFDEAIRLWQKEIPYYSRLKISGHLTESRDIVRKWSEDIKEIVMKYDFPQLKEVYDKAPTEVKEEVFEYSPPRLRL